MGERLRGLLFDVDAAEQRDVHREVVTHGLEYGACRRLVLHGEIGNLGSHELDVCRWAMPVGSAPKSTT